MAASLFEYRDGQDVFEGYVAYPASEAPAPCVLIAHDWSGPGAWTHELAHGIAALGYVAFAIDLYGKGRRGRTAEASAALMQPLLDDRGLIHQRFRLAMDVAQEDGRVDGTALAAIGHCFGGLCVLDMARIGAAMRGVVSVHGVLTPPPQPGRATVRARILMLHGQQDPFAPPEDVAAIARELTAAGADWQLHTFGQAMHAFAVPHADDPAAGLRYHEPSARRSRALIAHFLAELFAP